ncbi:MAG: DUF1461 domain-containing protein [Coriobacteriales bacterium]|jgi:integral membrane protein (TIGR01906 family)|nr:DUF1461 domain-containing protein [Coriobacteriales bacterium]
MGFKQRFPVVSPGAGVVVSVWRVLLTALLAFWLLGASFALLLLTPVTHLLAEVTVNADDSAYDHDTLVGFADEGLRFCLGFDLEQIPLGDDDHTSWTADVVSHMLDVRAVFQGALLLVGLVTLTLAVGLPLYARYQGVARLGRLLRIAGIIPLVLTVVLSVVGAIGFEALFTAMHKLFFTEGSWTFAYDSLLICTYPTTFWIGCAIIWAAALLLMSTTSILLGHYLSKRNSNPRQ